MKYLVTAGPGTAKQYCDRIAKARRLVQEAAIAQSGCFRRPDFTSDFSHFLPELSEIRDDVFEKAIYAPNRAYDKRKVYDQRNAHSPQVTIVIPPRRDARLWQHGNARAERLKRDENVRAIRRLGRQAWKHQAGYHQRSLVETTMYRLKTIFGQRLSTRLLETQNTQALIRCAGLNRMTQLGMPQSYQVA